MQTVGHESHENVRFDPLFQLVIDRPQGQVIFEILERGLEAQLLAARKIIQPLPWWRRPVRLVTAAAAVVLVACSLVIWFGAARHQSFSEFHSFAANMTATRIERLDFASQNAHEVRQWLAKRGDTPADFVIPAGLNGRPSIGCCVMNWRGQKVSMICFELENQKVAHLFVVDRAELRNVPSVAQGLAAENGINTVSWSDQSMCTCSQANRAKET